MIFIVRSSIVSVGKEAAIDDLVSMTTDKAGSLRYESKKTALFNQLLNLKEISKRMANVAKELRVYHGIMLDSASTARQKKLR